MVEDFGEGIDSGFEEEKKDNKIWIIIAVVVVVLCCCCIVGAAGVSWLWKNGDQLIEGWGSVLNLSTLLL